ncbi:hypothetical protein DDQ41_00100 [Streptomyces spongiicola]|uniref:Uncharacterized protein n=1 Tax=Streptomyces spongiicola TaxID=1690221 RepID=A0ABN5K9Q4_9ACTN|nr:hypothetical protein DDQ41_00100 [Streptomyces spongiicola]
MAGDPATPPADPCPPRAGCLRTEAVHLDRPCFLRPADQGRGTTRGGDSAGGTRRPEPAPGLRCGLATVARSTARRVRGGGISHGVVFPQRDLPPV